MQINATFQERRAMPVTHTAKPTKNKTVLKCPLIRIQNIDNTEWFPHPEQA